MPLLNRAFGNCQWLGKSGVLNQEYWGKIARRIGTYRHTVWRWTEGKVRPNVKHMMALLDLADDYGPGAYLHGLRRHGG